MSALRAHVRVTRRVRARLEVAAGTTVAVMGPSGAGKSTLLAAIAGTVPIDEGEIAIGDRVLSDPRPRTAVHRRGAVLLGQDPRLFPHLTIRGNIAFGPRSRGVAARTATARADELLERVGLADCRDRRPADLSGGQQQRAALARALAAEPAVLLLDEPLTALDPATAAGVRAVLADLLTGVTTVLVTHDALDAAALADRLVLLEDGVATQDGPVREVLTRPATAFAAAVAGLDRVVGECRDGAWRSGPFMLPSAAPAGTRLAAVFAPADVAIDPGERGTDAAGSWTARIDRLEQTPAGVRVHTSAPVVAADIPVAAAFGLAPGDRVCLTVPPEAVRLIPA